MKDFFSSLWTQLKDSGPGAKLILAIALVAIAGVAVFASRFADRPSFVLLYSGLDPHHSSAVQSALAGAGVRYQVSQPPGPFVVHVDESQYYAAQNAVALAGALEQAPEGIQSSQSGPAQVFLSSSERAQNALKREWQELEKQLEELDFVERAHVSSSAPDRSVLRRSPPMTVAVTLGLRGGTELKRSQAATVARIVRYRFNVPAQNVIIADQTGRSLFDGEAESDIGGAASGLLEHRERYDKELAERTNAVLDRVFGHGLATVVVASDWTFEETESVSEKLDPKNKAVVSETSSKSTTPLDGAGNGGGPAGTSANLTAEFGSTNAAIPPTGSSSDPAPEVLAQTSEVQKNTIVGKETQLKKSSAPRLNRLTVSLFLDESQKARLGDLEAAVKNAVGFDDKRSDMFSSMVTPFASVQRDAEGKIVVPEPPKAEEGPSRTTEILIQRGVEIAVALAFLFVLFKALKSAKSASSKSSPRSRSTSVAANSTAAPAFTADDVPQGMNDAQFLELLAKSQVEELLKTDPERVSSILSRWAAEEETVKAGA